MHAQCRAGSADLLTVRYSTGCGYACISYSVLRADLPIYRTTKVTAALLAICQTVHFKLIMLPICVPRMAPETRPAGKRSTVKKAPYPTHLAPNRSVHVNCAARTHAPLERWCILFTKRYHVNLISIVKRRFSPTKRLCKLKMLQLSILSPPCIVHMPLCD